MTEPAPHDPMGKDSGSQEPEPWDPETDPDGYTYDDISPKDIYLDTLLNFYAGSTDQSDGGIGITLQSNGSIVSGIVISRKAWIEATLNSFAAAAGKEMGDAVGFVFKLINDKQIEKYKKRDDAKLPAGRRNFIHMKDVHVTVGGANDHYALPTWRGSLADVTGWSLGSWNPTQSG